MNASDSAILSAEGTVKKSTVYHLPAEPRDYFASKAERIDRWYQARNSSNVTTTGRIIDDLLSRYRLGRPHRLVDPFAGAGSTAVTARRMNVPFLGIEIDPVLACVTLAKATSSRGDMRLFGPAQPALPTGLEVLRHVSRFSAPIVWRDLRHSPAPSPASRVIWGDAVREDSWRRLGPADELSVVYTSPPFGHTRVEARWTERTLRSARRALEAGGHASPFEEPAAEPAYEDLVLRMLRLASAYLKKALVILEYEPARGTDESEAVARSIEEHTDAETLDVLRTRNFSGHGALSFIVCRIG